MIPDIKFACICPQEHTCGLCVVCESFEPCKHCEEDGCDYFNAYIGEVEE